MSSINNNWSNEEMKMKLMMGLTSAMVLSATGAAFATDNSVDCSKVPSFDQLNDVVKNAVSATAGDGGFGLHMWTTIVNRDGYVCGRCL